MVLGILWDIFVFLLSAIPLYLAVRFMGGKTGLIKTALVVFVSGIVVSAIKEALGFFGGAIAFIVMIWIYHEVFRLKWAKAFLAWLLQFIFIALFYLLAFVLLVIVLGLSVGAIFI